MEDGLYHTDYWKARDWLVIDEMTRHGCFRVVVHPDIDFKGQRNEHVGPRYSMYF